MADKTVEQLQKELAEAKAKEKQLLAENKKAKAENKTLRVAMDQGKKVGEDIKGSYEAKWTHEGEEVSKKVSFKKGHKYLFITGQKMLTEVVLAVANGKKVSAAQLKANPQLGDLTEKMAREHLTYLAQIDYGHLK